MFNFRAWLDILKDLKLVINVKFPIQLLINIVISLILDVSKCPYENLFGKKFVFILWDIGHLRRWCKIMNLLLTIV